MNSLTMFVTHNTAFCVKENRNENEENNFLGISFNPEDDTFLAGSPQVYHSSHISVCPKNQKISYRNCTVDSKIS